MKQVAVKWDAVNDCYGDWGQLHAEQTSNSPPTELYETLLDQPQCWQGLLEHSQSIQL